jgi:hypothetical protein
MERSKDNQREYGSMEVTQMTVKMQLDVMDNEERCSHNPWVVGSSPTRPTRPTHASTHRARDLRRHPFAAVRIGTRVNSPTRTGDVYPCGTEGRPGDAGTSTPHPSFVGVDDSLRQVAALELFLEVNVLGGVWRLLPSPSPEASSS